MDTTNKMNCIPSGHSDQSVDMLAGLSFAGCIVCHVLALV